MNQLTLRQIPTDVQKSLKVTAKKNGVSLNKAIIGLLKKALHLGESSKKRDLSKLAGTWSSGDASEFKKNTASFEKLDKEVWK